MDATKLAPSASVRYILSNMSLFVTDYLGRFKGQKTGYSVLLNTGIYDWIKIDEIIEISVNPAAKKFEISRQAFYSTGIEIRLTTRRR
jgi:hypothetical protein